MINWILSLFKKPNQAIKDKATPAVCKDHYWSNWKTDKPIHFAVMHEESIRIQYRYCLSCQKLDWYNESLHVTKNVLKLYDNPWKKDE